MTKTHNTAETQFVEANGVKYAYRRFGSGDRTPLLCLPHFRAGLDNWDPALTDGLAASRSVILLNNAGIASSGGEPADTISGMAQHVITFSHALGLETVDIFGHSMGGFVAQQVALDKPALVRRLILAGTGPEGGESMKSYPELAAHHATQEIPVEENFLYLFFSPTETSQAAGKAFWVRRHARKEQDLPSSMAAMRAQAAAIGAWGAVPSSDRYAKLSDIKNAVLVLNGREDIMVPTINSFILQQKLPNAELVLFPDSGHGAIFQYPGRVTELVTNFLDREIQL